MPCALGHALGQNFLENFEFPRGSYTFSRHSDPTPPNLTYAYIALGHAIARTMDNIFVFAVLKRQQTSIILLNPMFQPKMSLWNSIAILPGPNWQKFQSWAA